MLFLFPLLALLPRIIYLLAALLPAFLLLRYVYRHDRIEKEPAGLLISLLIGGCLSAIASGFLEGIGEYLLHFFLTPDSKLYIIALAFLVVAAVEEGTKLYFLKRRSWYHPAFNYRFDGVVYAVFTSLGFAALENVQYVARYGLSVAMPRALTAIPGHMSFAVFMGVYYARAKDLDNHGDPVGSRRALLTGYLLAVFLHGFYDSCAMLGTGLASFAFLAFIILVFFHAFHTVKLEADADHPITPFDPPFER